MTAPLFLLDSARLARATPGTVVTLDGAEGRHARTVRRIAVGETILLTDGAGTRVTGDVCATTQDSLDITVRSVDHDPQPTPRLVLVQALAKNDRDDQAVEAATELGVDEIVPWQASRSIVQWKADRGAKAHRKWEQLVLAATKQSRRTRLPVVAPLATTRTLAERATTATTLVLHEDASTPIGAARLPPDGDVLVVVGPEGGISPDELELLQQAGAQAVRLGPHVLRSSSAGPAALAVLLARLRW